MPNLYFIEVTVQMEYTYLILFNWYVTVERSMLFAMGNGGAGTSAGKRVDEMVRKKGIPYVTLVLIVLNVVYYFIVASGGSTSDLAYMISRGADCAPYVFEKYEYWRLLTSMFMHFSFQHLAGNMIYLGLMGFSYEHVVGHLKFLLVYMLSGIGGGVVSCAYYQVTGQAVVSAGASGAVYGLVAMVIYLMYTARKRSGMKPLMYRMAIVLLFLVYSNFGAGRGVDIAAHLGGLVFGFVVSILFLSSRTKRQK